ncbi:phosphoribosylanthranilate isomerase [Roseivivax lentus]|uniref:N-(5'-phosphoribosyl)anthranilate isomerase n=1 Tax=Roseivivax lentus TaxID=633194 RepID=A0A1N7L764_9RHOB|nr:phosphoribosylanthranilate isomerase [Roseivivax lentus]SIS69689.1 phosphoribosylanthranilate isomerase [Roseivivax lentus]
MADVRVKICGLTRAEDVAAAAAAGAAYLGFVFFPKSPRNVSVAEARALAVEAPFGVAKVGLLVDPDDALLDAIAAEVPLDMIQLHGRESPDRVAEVRARMGLPVMKALGVASEADLEKVAAYGRVADQLLIDAKAPEGAALPGGNGLAFDWTLVQGKRWPVPWMLAGGLTPETAGRAVTMTGAQQLDVSSGVESAPGVKDAAKMRAFIAATQSAGEVPRL